MSQDNNTAGGRGVFTKKPTTTFTNLEPLTIFAQIVRSFPPDVVDSLWQQGVNMDDWDYAVLAPPDAIVMGEDGLYPHEYTLERIMTGCCDNTWYLAVIRGQEYAIGIAYHS